MILAPEILKMRDALLERIGDKSPKEVAEIVNEILLNETNNINRLAALSARVHILRAFTEKEYGKKSAPNLKKLNSKNEDIKTQDDFTKLKQPKTDPVNNKETWVRVEMLKSGIVNGVRFPEGVVIDVNQSDAGNLEKQELAKIIEVIDSNEVSVSEKTISKDNEGENTEKNQAVKVDASEKTEEKKQAKNNSSRKIAKENTSLEDNNTKVANIDTSEETVNQEVAEDVKEVNIDTSEETVNQEAAEDVKEANIDTSEETVNQEAAEDVKEANIDTSEETVNQENTEKSKKVKNKSGEKLDENLSMEIKDPITKEKEVDRKILKKKSTKITEETIELTDPKAVAEALGLNEKKKKEEEPIEIEEEVDLESLETGK